VKKNIRMPFNATAVKVFALIIGLFLMQIYILGLRYSESEIFPAVIFLGASLLVPLSLTLLWGSHGHRQKPLLLLTLIFVTSFSLIKIPTSRFDFIPGTDLLGEYDTAERTYASPKWPLNLPIEPIVWRVGRWNYFWTTSVTLLPSTISHVTGLPMIYIFEVVFPLISAIVPILIFLVIRKIFDARVAALSSITFILSPIYVTFFNLTRENLALVSFLLSLLCVLKSVRNSDSRFRLLALIFAFTTVTFHYVMGNFAMLTFLVFWLSPKLHRVFGKISTRKYLNRFFQTEWRTTTIVTPTLFLFIVVSVFVWFSLVTPMLWQHIRIFSNAIEALAGLTPPLKHYLVGQVWISSLGVYHTIISNLIKILIVIGFFIALKTSNSIDKFSLTLLGGAVLMVLVGWAVIPWLSMELHIDRIYAVGLSIFSTFIALSLTKLSSKLPQWKFFLPIFFMTIIFLDGILTMPSIYWHAKGSLDAKEIMIVPNRGPSLITLGTWIDENVDKKNVLLADVYTTDVKIYAEIQVSGKDIYNFFDVSDPSVFAFHAGYRYVIASSWLLEGYICFWEKTSGERIVWMISEEKIQPLYDKFNILYCNGNYSMFYLPMSPEE